LRTNEEKYHWLTDKKMRGEYAYLLKAIVSFLLTGCFFIATAQHSNITLADPTIFTWKGKYYLYGTGGDTKGFLVYESLDCKTWKGPVGKLDGYCLRKGQSFGQQGFWAPQVFEHNGKFYMAYTADEQIAIATSDDPLGPFIQKNLKPISGQGKQIDPFVFKDDDGTFYLYHVQLREGNRIYVAKLNQDLSDLLPESVQPVLYGTETWENTAASKWPVTEGPTVVKHGQRYYILYSANDFRNMDYAVGYAVSNSPLGPWEKVSGSPVINRKEIKYNGPGHGDLFYLPDGSMAYVLHTHFSDSVVQPRLTGLIQIEFEKAQPYDRLVIKKNSFQYLFKSN
jgi:xylan 1,4-beta-xylosidase